MRLNTCLSGLGSSSDFFLFTNLAPDTELLEYVYAGDRFGGIWSKDLVDSYTLCKTINLTFITTVNFMGVVNWWD